MTKPKQPAYIRTGVFIFSLQLYQKAYFDTMPDISHNASAMKIYLSRSESAGGTGPGEGFQEFEADFPKKAGLKMLNYY